MGKFGTQSLGMLALMLSSVATAATVTAIPSTFFPVVGNLFTVTLRATDIVNMGGATMSMTWDVTKAALTIPPLVNRHCPTCLPLTGPVAQGTDTRLVMTLPSFHLLPPFFTPVNGDFDFAVFTFTALAAGAMDFEVFENAVQFDGWFDIDTAEPFAVTYVNFLADVTVVPIPPAAWLFGSALGVIGWMRRTISS